MESKSNNVKVSVVMPVYNVKNYIEECLDSLINQTLEEIEIICVDDGSTDGTLELLHEYETKCDKVKVIQQQNQFAGVARNNGMKHATGEYIIFLDSDDFFEVTMLEKMYTEAKRTAADLVLCGGQIFDDEKKETKPAPWFFKAKILPQEVPFSYRDTDGQLLNAISPAPWTKLFKREFVKKNGVQFQNFQNSNDVYFIYVSVCTAERISYVDEALVNYRRGMTSNLQSKKNKAPLCFLDAYYSAYKTLVEKGVYEYVKKGFRSAVISGCLYNFDSYHYLDAVSRAVLLEAFQKETFLELNLFDGEREEYIDWNKTCRLKGLVEGYAWKKRQVVIQQNHDSRCLKENSCEYIPKVSVIIPCYNVEDYVEECLNSILNQTLKEIEVICVNDGSVDKTESILLEIAERDVRVSVLTQDNAGQGTARNEGVKRARGEYLYFMDSDDILEMDALEYLYGFSKEKYLDVLYFDGNSFYETEELEREKPDYIEYYQRKNDYSHVETGMEMLLEMKRNAEYRQSPCLQFIRHEYFLEKELWYLQGIWHEDNSFTFKTMIFAEKVAHIPRVFFNRRVRANSVMTLNEKFVHAYGLFCNYLDMLKTVENMQFTLEQEEVVAKLLADVLRQARKKWRLLVGEERYKYQSLNGLEKSLFFAYIVHSKLDVDELTKEKKNLLLQIKNLQNNQKNLEKKLNKEKKAKKKILKSKTYKVALLIRKPYDFLRKLCKKISGVKG